MVKAKQFVGAVLTCIILALPLLLLEPAKAWAEEDTSKDAADKVSNLYGIGITAGNSLTPATDITFLQVNAFTLCDYEKVWRHPAPEALRFKMEYNVGTTVSSPQRTMISAGIFALYYLDFLTTKHVRPYIEGGIGAIYTDFKVEGQGLRFNFNPQAGIGTEILIDSKPAFYISVRTHHISNGEISRRENRGINSVVLVVGQYF